jgi:hypothetical protein
MAVIVMRSLAGAAFPAAMFSLQLLLLMFSLSRGGFPAGAVGFYW